ncbi:hypothetical protein GQ53DRAFT_825302 [Thozetella sp. PMI_491]|nr:hypothetical protein GQ53DRAFT_825302 [Thozetella sp. PMI_491]
MAANADYDLAFNPMLATYRVGKADRQQSQIIRVRNVIGQGSNRKGGTQVDALSWEDQAGAGKSWSAEELATDDAPATDLVLVIGEFLPANEETKKRNQKPADKGVISTSHPVDKYSHINTIPGTLLVVKRLIEKKSNFYVLIDKQDGLCRLAALPSEKDNRLFYYQEWTSEIATSAKKRTTLWGEAIRDHAMTIQEQRPEAVAKISDGSVNQRATLPDDTENKFAPFITLGADLELMAGNNAQLRFILPQNRPITPTLMAVDEEDVESLDHLINGTSNVRDKLVKQAAKELRDIHALDIDISEDHLRLLATELRQTKCGIERPLEIASLPIFIAHFLLWAEFRTKDGHVLNNKDAAFGAREAHRYTTTVVRLSTVSEASNQVNDASMAQSAAIRTLKYSEHRFTVLADAVRGVIQAQEEQLQRIPTTDFDAGTRGPGDSMDIDELRDYIFAVSRRLITEARHPMLSIVDQLEKERQACHQMIETIEAEKLSAEEEAPGVVI